MLTYNNQFEIELRALINEKIVAETEHLVLGMAANDFPSYREKVGRIAALKDALDLCDEAHSIMEKR